MNGAGEATEATCDHVDDLVVAAECDGATRRDKAIDAEVIGVDLERRAREVDVGETGNNSADTSGSRRIRHIAASTGWSRRWSGRGPQ